MTIGQARSLLVLFEIHLASIEMLSQLPLRLAINGAGTSRWSNRSRSEEECIGFVKANAGHAIEKTPAEWSTPVPPSRRLK